MLSQCVLNTVDITNKRRVTSYFYIWICIYLTVYKRNLEKQWKEKDHRT